MEKEEIGLVEKIINILFIGTPVELVIKLMAAIVLISIIGYFVLKLKNKEPSQYIGDNSNNNIQIGGDIKKGER